VLFRWRAVALFVCRESCSAALSAAPSIGMP